MQKNTKTIAATVVALLLLIALSFWMTLSRAQRANNHLDLADKYLQQKDYMRAVDEYQQAEQLRSSSIVRYLKARALQKAGRRDEAIAIYKELASVNDDTGRRAQISLDKLKSSSP